MAGKSKSKQRAKLAAARTYQTWSTPRSSQPDEDVDEDGAPYLPPAERKALEGTGGSSAFVSCTCAVEGGRVTLTLTTDGVIAAAISTPKEEGSPRRPHVWSGAAVAADQRERLAAAAEARQHSAGDDVVIHVVAKATAALDDSPGAAVGGPPSVPSVPAQLPAWSLPASLPPWPREDSGGDIFDMDEEDNERPEVVAATARDGVSAAAAQVAEGQGREGREGRGAHDDEARAEEGSGRRAEAGGERSARLVISSSSAWDSPGAAGSAGAASGSFEGATSSSYEGATSDAFRIARRRERELQMGLGGSQADLGLASSADSSALEAWPALPPSPVARGASAGTSPIVGFALGGGSGERTPTRSTPTRVGVRVEGAGGGGFSLGGGGCPRRREQLGRREWQQRQQYPVAGE